MSRVFLFLILLHTCTKLLIVAAECPTGPILNFTSNQTVALQDCQSSIPLVLLWTPPPSLSPSSTLRLCENILIELKNVTLGGIDWSACDSSTTALSVIVRNITIKIVAARLLHAGGGSARGGLLQITLLTSAERIAVWIEASNIDWFVNQTLSAPLWFGSQQGTSSSIANVDVRFISCHVTIDSINDVTAGALGLLFVSARTTARFNATILNTTLTLLSATTTTATPQTCSCSVSLVPS